MQELGTLKLRMSKVLSDGSLEANSAFNAFSKPGIRGEAVLLTPQDVKLTMLWGSFG